MFTAMISWSLENSMELSSSMRARGYGLHGRTNFSLFKFGARDAAVLLSGLLLFAAVLIASAAEASILHFIRSSAKSAFR